MRVAYLIALVPALALLAGLILVIEMTYHLSVKASEGTTISVFHVALDSAGAMPWVAAAALVAGGFLAVSPNLAVVGAAWHDAFAYAHRVETREMTAPRSNSLTCTRISAATQIIRGVSLAVPAGERHAIIGPNGAGKSTLFNLISGLLGPTSGTVRLKGEDVTGLPPYQINRRGLSRSFQVTNIFPRLSVWENVRCAVLWSLGYKYAFWRGIGGLADVRERTETILEADRFDRPPPRPGRRVDVRRAACA